MGEIRTRTNHFADEYTPIVKEIELSCILKHEHRKILKESVPFSCSISMRPRNMWKNRYDDVLCFDYNRVILPAKEGENDFINASYVDDHKARRRFICCQAPLQETVQDWWTMIFTHKVRVIVMLTRIEEEGRELCFPYWSPVKGKSVVFGKFTIKTKKIKVFDHHIVTSLRVRGSTGAFLDVKHFAYTDWPAHSVPQKPSDFLDFVFAVRKAQSKAKFDKNSKSFPPMVIHCSAGLNRTGTFAAILICLACFDENLKIDLASVVRNLRRQRWNCLSLPQYYIFCYRMVSEYAKLVKK